MSTSCSQPRYYLELSLALLAYACVLVGSIFLLKHFAPLPPWREMFALSPMVPGIFVIWVVLRQLRRLDELQCRIQMEAIAFAFIGTAFLTFGYGFLEGLGYPRMSQFVVWPTMAVLWIVGRIVASRRYQ